MLGVTVEEYYKTLFETIQRLGYFKIHMLFIGPGLVSLDKKNALHFIFEEFVCKNGLSVSVMRRKLMYNEFVSNEDFTVPDIILMFNAGIWGYPSWIPSLESIRNFKCKHYYLIRKLK